MGQICRISVMDQSRGAVDEKGGSSLGHLAEVVFRLPNILRGGGVQTTTENRGFQSKRAFRGLI